MRTSSAARTLLCLLVAPLVASCSAPSDTAPSVTAAPWAWEPFTDLIASAIDEATAGGASDQQIALLTRAQLEGRMPIDLVKNAAFNVIDCFNSVGGEATYEETTEASGLLQPGYKALFDEDLPDALYLTCETREFRWVNYVYQMQPSSREIVGQYVMSKETVLRQCLEDAGYSTDPEATGWELAQQAAELPGDSTGFDCLFTAQINGL